jgi:hypothetical protein
MKTTEGIGIYFHTDIFKRYSNRKLPLKSNGLPRSITLWSFMHKTEQEGNVPTILVLVIHPGLPWKLCSKTLIKLALQYLKGRA